jgi:hypothetical protein
MIEIKTAGLPAIKTHPSKTTHPLKLSFGGSGSSGSGGKPPPREATTLVRVFCLSGRGNCGMGER